MNKDEFAEALRDAGFKAEIEDGCVMAYVPEITKAVEKTITGIAEAEGYYGSYGWKKIQT